MFWQRNKVYAEQRRLFGLGFPRLRDATTCNLSCAQSAHANFIRHHGIHNFMVAYIHYNPSSHGERDFVNNKFFSQGRLFPELSNQINRTENMLNNEANEDDDVDESPAVPESTETSWNLTKTTKIHTIDPLARARIQNYLLRNQGGQSETFSPILASVVTPSFNTSDGSANIFELSSQRQADALVYRAQLQVPLPKELEGHIVATGYALLAREACHTAAMHAERVLDALNVPVCGLKRAQEKYAAAKKHLGLQAPISGSKMRNPKETPIPSALFSVRENRSQHIFKTYIPIRYTCFYGNRFALVSPTNLDEFCVPRITQYCEKNAKQRFEELFSYETIHSHLNEKKNGTVFSQGRHDIMETVRSWHHASLKLSVPERYGIRNAKGFAPNRRQARIIACMHAELILDTLGIPIFADAVEQEAHATVSERFGRGAPHPGESPAPKETPSPPALRMAFPKERIHPDSPQYVDSYLEKFSSLKVRRFPSMNDISTLDDTAQKNLEAFFEIQNLPIVEHILLEKIVVGDAHGVYKAMTHLPFPETLGFFFGIGIASTPLRARQVCAIHALKILQVLHIPRTSECSLQEIRKRFKELEGEDTKALQSKVPPPLRYADGIDHIPSFLSYMKAELVEKEHDAFSPEVIISEPVSIKPDSEDCVLLPPEESLTTGASDMHTLVDPRKFDVHSIERIDDYLRRHGMYPEDALDIENIGDLSSSSFFRVKLILPVPPQFGSRWGIGEAPTKQEANVLAHMHAELILDYLGLPLFDHEALQYKHAVSARKKKRWAPFPGSRPRPVTSLTPPILRKERSDSMKWLRFLREKFQSKMVDITASHVKPSTIVDWDYVGPEEIDFDAKVKLFHHIVTHPKNRSVTTLDKRFELSQEGESSMTYHYCRIKLDVPEHRGKVVEAKGAATSRADAETLCCMHAIRILDAFGLRLFFLNGMQDRHAARTRKEGRWARFSTEPPPPSSRHIEPPSPLRIDAAGPKPKSPLTPSPECTEAEWDSYLLKAETFVKEMDKWELSRHTLQNKLPPFGDKLIDDTLQSIEKKPTDIMARMKLQNYCQIKGLEFFFPDFKEVGNEESARFIASANVPGYMGLQSYGLGLNKEEATRRCAMHALEILFKLDSTASGLDLISRNWDKKNLDRNVQVMHDESRHKVVELYCLSRDLPLPKFIIKPRTIRSSRMYSVSAEIGEFKARTESSHHQQGLTQCLNILMNKMIKYDPVFREMQTFLRGHPFLSAQTVLNLQISDDLLRRMNNVSDFVENTIEEKETAPTESRHKQQDAEFAHFPGWHYTPEQCELHSKKLLNAKHQRELNPEYTRSFGKKRASLPIAASQEKLLDLLYGSKNSVLVLCGTTGCGKTTQVPQFILDYHIEKGEGHACRILITQPRRISATSISRRISAERMESIGDNIGYIIRLDSKPGKNVTFITSGVLLRMLKSNPLLRGFSHVIVDEIHERDIHSDFLLILLRDLLSKRSDLKLILMSATLQAQLFSDYFGGAPVLEIAGGTYPIEIVSS